MADRLAAVIRQRQLREQQRLVERADAERARRDASQILTRARRARAAATVPVGSAVQARDLVASRVQALALEEAVADAHDGHAAAERALAQAEANRIEAAVARCSVERLRERREEAERVRQERMLQRREEEAALRAWRRSR